MATTTLSDLQAAADAANTKLQDARRRLEICRAEVVEASADYHAAVVASVSDQPPPAAPATKARTAATVDPVAATSERLAKALADYDQVRRELGV